MFVALNKEYVGMTTVVDEVPSIAATTVSNLKSLNYQVFMVRTGFTNTYLLLLLTRRLITGGREEVDADVARAVGVEKYWSETSPTMKKATVQHLHSAGKIVAVVSFGRSL